MGGKSYTLSMPRCPLFVCQPIREECPEEGLCVSQIPETSLSKAPRRSSALLLCFTLMSNRHWKCFGEISSLSSLVTAILGKEQGLGCVCRDWCGNNLSFIQIRCFVKCAGLLEVTHFWQLIVPGRDKRQMRGEQIVGALTTLEPSQSPQKRGWASGLAKVKE